METVCVHGLGYIGLPTAATLAEAGHDVVGYDASDAIVDRLQRGLVRFAEPGLESMVTKVLQSGALRIRDEPVPADYHLICVPTPLGENDTANLQSVEAAGETIADLLRPEDTVVLESTVPPGTTTDVLRPILEGDGLVAGQTFGLVYSPETVLPGNILVELRQNDRIVGSVGETAPASVVDLYESFVTGTIHTTDATTAEVAKLTQNTYRDVNVALANEVAKRCYDNDVDSADAIDLANSHPRVDVLSPGPGVGGHCLPVDPYFLVQDTSEPSLVRAARAVNDSMADHVVRILADTLGDLEGRSVALLGVAYKGNVDDIRRSPALAVVDRLRTRTDGDVEIALADPVVEDETLDLEPIEAAVSGADAAVVTADHDAFRTLDPVALVDRFRQPTIVDTKELLDLDRWRDAGFTTASL